MIGLDALFWTFAASVLICRLMMWVPLLDRPDGARKVQAQAVPRTGGLGIGLVMVGAIAVFTPGVLAVLASDTALVALGVYVFSAGLLGLADDAWGLPARLKLILIAVPAVYAAYAGPELGVPLPGVLTVTGFALWLFVMPNVVNFMDGANGLALGCSAIILIGFALIWLGDFGFGHAVIWSYLGALSVLAGAAICGFLWWNMQGRVYAGDAGALAVGAIIASLGGVAASETSIWLPATFVLPFLVDVFMTLLWRARRGENLLTPHRHHAYQYMIRLGTPHWRVSVLWWGMTGVCVAAGAMGAKLSGSAAGLGAPAFWIFLTGLTLGCGLWTWQRRRSGHELPSEEG